MDVENHDYEKGYDKGLKDGYVLAIETLRKKGTEVGEAHTFGDMLDNLWQDDPNAGGG